MIDHLQQRAVQLLQHQHKQQCTGLAQTQLPALLTPVTVFTALRANFENTAEADLLCKVRGAADVGADLAKALESTLQAGPSGAGL